MKIREGFVSNSSSSSFIIKNIDKREDYAFDFPPISSLSERRKWEKKKGTSDVFMKSMKGQKYRLCDIEKVIKKHGCDAFLLDHYEENFLELMKPYECIIMSISAVTHDQTPTLCANQWGKDWIWNPCSFKPFGIYVDNRAKRTLNYSDNPLYRMFTNSAEFKKATEKIEKAKTELKEYENKGRNIPAKILEWAYKDMGEVMCSWCHKNGGAVCFDVARAVDEGDFYIYANENYLPYGCLEELEKRFQCIVYARHMG